MRLGRVDENLSAPIELDFEPRYMRWRTLPNQTGGSGVTHDKLGYAEFELYGRGFANESRFETTVADLGQPAIFNRVHFGVSRWRRVDAGWAEVVDADGEVIDRRWQVGELIPAVDADAEVCSGQDRKNG